MSIISSGCPAREGCGRIENSYVNNDNVRDTLDLNYLIAEVYLNGPAPLPVRPAGDCNCDRKLNLADIVLLIGHINNGYDLTIPCYEYDY